MPRNAVASYSERREELRHRWRVDLDERRAHPRLGHRERKRLRAAEAEPDNADPAADILAGGEVVEALPHAGERAGCELG